MGKIRQTILNLALLGSFFSSPAIIFAQNAILSPDSPSEKNYDTPSEQASLLKTEGEVAQNSHVLFTDKDIQGSGGTIFLGYSAQLEDFILQNSSSLMRNNLTFGGTFFFLFKNYLRLGVEGSIIKPLATNNPSGYTLGALVEVLTRLDPALFEFGLSIGYGDYSDKPYFSLFPKIGIGLRVTNDFSASVIAGYMLFIHSASFSDPKEIIKQSQPFLGLSLTFGAF